MEAAPASAVATKRGAATFRKSRVANPLKPAMSQAWANSLKVPGVRLLATLEAADKMGAKGYSLHSPSSAKVRAAHPSVAPPSSRRFFIAADAIEFIRGSFW